jgi:hypothetical protein
MARIHCVLQAKGGVGKSFISAMLAQYMQQRGETPLCIDTDPMNQTFAGYKALHVRKLELMAGDEIDVRNFDKLLEWLAEVQTSAVVDNGAATFVPLVNYLITNQTATLLADLGHELVIHTVVTGGQALLDTVNGFSQLVSHFPDPATFVVWLNPFWGPVADGNKSFHDFKGYKENAKRISAVIDIPAVQAATFGRDVEEVLKARMTFDEALAEAGRSIAVRQRLKLYRQNLFTQMDGAGVL